MDDQDTSTPREDDRNDELSGSPVPDPEDNERKEDALNILKKAVAVRADGG